MPVASNPRSALLLGLDVGSTVVKAVLFDLRGRVIAAAEATVPVDRPYPGWVERDADATWHAAVAVIRRTVRGQAARIAAVGVTGCGNGAVLLDRRGRPLRAGILSSDTRATDFLQPFDGRRDQQAYAGQLPVLLAWVRAREPAVARRLAYAVFWKDFIRVRLTGVVASDFTDAGAAGLLDFPSQRMRRGDPAFPPLQASLATAGEITCPAAELTGLVAGTPVFTGCIDCEAAAIGSGVHAVGHVSIVAGTWSINQTYVDHPPRRGRHFLVNPSVEPGRWLVVEGSPNSAANFEWVLSLFGSDATTASRAASRRPATDLLFIPHVPAGRGAFVGLRPEHGSADLFRAVMEGVVFAHRDHVAKLATSMGKVRRVTLCGGAARSPFWCQLFADGLGCPVDVPRGEQLGAWGAALCAGVGLGRWTSVVSAQRAMVPRLRTYSPDSHVRAVLDRAYKRYGCSLDLLLA
ncbi:MAG: carbohydrate kinase [Opitutaceae bacterium]|nr:carbohydrate kinase [Opitutaceae bacterium]